VSETVTDDGLTPERLLSTPREDDPFEVRVVRGLVEERDMYARRFTEECELTGTLTTELTTLESKLKIAREALEAIRGNDWGSMNDLRDDAHEALEEIGP
jgi:hypothetical protein